MTILLGPRAPAALPSTHLGEGPQTWMTQLRFPMECRIFHGHYPSGLTDAFPPGGPLHRTFLRVFWECHSNTRLLKLSHVIILNCIRCSSEQSHENL